MNSTSSPSFLRDEYQNTLNPEGLLPQEWDAIESMNALSEIHRDPKWYHQTLTDPGKLADLVAQRGPGTFAVGNRDTTYFLIHSLSPRTSSIENLSELMAQGIPFDEIQRIHQCTVPLFGKQAKKGDSPRELKTSVDSIATEESARPLEMWIEELEDPRWFWPGHTEGEIETELRYSPLGTYLVSKNGNNEYALYWSMSSSLRGEGKVYTTNLRIKYDCLFLSSFPNELFESFEALKNHHQFVYPLTQWQASREERHANIVAIEADALKKD